jgi:serine/threonine protein kinase
MEKNLLKVRPDDQKRRVSFHFENNRFLKTFTDAFEIGRGSYGTVYMARHKVENRIYAVKRIKL